VGAPGPGSTFWDDPCRAWQVWDVNALTACEVAAAAGGAGREPHALFLRGLVAAMTEGRMTLSHWDAAYLGFADQHDDAGCGLVARAALVLCVIDQSAMRHVQDWLQRARIHARAPEARAPAALWHWGRALGERSGRWRRRRQHDVGLGAASGLPAAGGVGGVAEARTRAPVKQPVCQRETDLGPDPADLLPAGGPDPSLRRPA
jgi:hypothetical protein